MTTTKIMILEFENYMKKYNWTQAYAAERLECSPSHLSRILRGEKNPSIKLLDKMEEIMEEQNGR